MAAALSWFLLESTLWVCLRYPHRSSQVRALGAKACEPFIPFRLPRVSPAKMTDARSNTLHHDHAPLAFGLVRRLDCLGLEPPVAAALWPSSQPPLRGLGCVGKAQLWILTEDHSNRVSLFFVFGLTSQLGFTIAFPSLMSTNAPH